MCIYKLNSIISIPVLFSLLLVISACKKDCKSKEITYTVLDKTKAEVPYTGYDTLTFIRTSVGDTHVFIGQGKTKDIKKTQDAADCPYKYTSENYYYTYTSKTFNDPILIGYNCPGGTFNHYLLFQDQKFEDDLSYESPYPDLDSIIVLNKTYYKIQVMPDNRPNTSPFISYFTKEMGCVKIKFPDNETWELLSLKQ